MIEIIASRVVPYAVIGGIDRRGLFRRARMERPALR